MSLMPALPCGVGLVILSSWTINAQVATIITPQQLVTWFCTATSSNDPTSILRAFPGVRDEAIETKNESDNLLIRTDSRLFKADLGFISYSSTRERRSDDLGTQHSATVSFRALERAPFNDTQALTSWLRSLTPNVEAYEGSFKARGISGYSRSGRQQTGWTLSARLDRFQLGWFDSDRAFVRASFCKQ